VSVTTGVPKVTRRIWRVSRVWRVSRRWLNAMPELLVRVALAIARGFSIPASACRRALDAAERIL
jgi:hypothetical protein